MAVVGVPAIEAPPIVVDKNNKVKTGREADRRSPFIPRHDDIITRRDCIESFYITAGSIAPVAAIRRLAVNIERPGVIRRAIKITILSHEAGFRVAKALYPPLLSNRVKSAAGP